MADALSAVPGVRSVKTDIETKTARLTPQKPKGPSPRALWEAVEKAGVKPIKLTGPDGEFTQKPDS